MATQSVLLAAQQPLGAAQSMLFAAQGSLGVEKRMLFATQGLLFTVHEQTGTIQSMLKAPPKGPLALYRT